MVQYKVSIDPDALDDIQQATDWYNEQLPGLGKKFQKNVRVKINNLRFLPKKYPVRFANIRCVLVKRFPFLKHYALDEKHKTDRSS